MAGGDEREVVKTLCLIRNTLTVSFWCVFFLVCVCMFLESGGNPTPTKKARAAFCREINQKDRQLRFNEITTEALEVLVYTGNYTNITRLVDALNDIRSEQFDEE